MANVVYTHKKPDDDDNDDNANNLFVIKNSANEFLYVRVEHYYGLFIYKCCDCV